MTLNQHTLKKSFSFAGKGLHTGTSSKITVLPAPADTGICFCRVDLGGVIIPALAENVSNTARSTTISAGDASVATVEHLLSALTGMGVDNARIEIDGLEVPILDGSARYYVEAIARDGLEDQGVPRQMLTLPDSIEIKDEKSGSWIRIEPSDTPGIDITVDFNSRVLGVQNAQWNPETDYATQIGVCRTFVFFHEIEFLFKNGLIKGGDVDNAIVIVEHPVSEAQIEELSGLMGRPALSVTTAGYLNNLELHFPNECGRHKLLDLIGDLRLCGGPLAARVTAFKPGHTLNTNAAKAIRAILKQIPIRND